MTMPNDLAKPPRQLYVENGIAVYSIDYKFVEANDIVVYRKLGDEGDEILLVQPTDYTVQGGNWDVGQITLAEPHVGAEIRIDRLTDRQQLLDFVAGDDFSEESQERGYDRLTMIVQELYRDALRKQDILNIVAEQLKAGEGIGLALADQNETITITNLFNAEYIRDRIGEVLVAGTGIQITVNDAQDKITISATGSIAGDVGNLADCLLLSGDQQAGGYEGTGQLAATVLEIVAAALAGIGISVVFDPELGTITLDNDIDGETIRDSIGEALVAGAGIEINVNDAGNQITISAPNGNLTAESVRDILGATLVAGAGIQINVNDAGDTVTLSSDRLDASYKGIVPTSRDADFEFNNAMNARSTFWTGGNGTATIRLEADVALEAGWVHRIRNMGTGNLLIHRVGAGVFLFKNGATNSADALLAPGGTVTIERWAANDFTITGPGI